jgi:hypothetical protein
MKSFFDGNAFRTAEVRKAIEDIELILSGKKDLHETREFLREQGRKRMDKEQEN